MELKLSRIIALVLFSIWFYRALVIFGFYHSKLNLKHFEGFECHQKLEGLGAEDIATTSDGLAFITSGLIYPPFQFKQKVGKIYVTDLEKSPVTILEPKIVSEKDLKLNPHGIDLIEIDGKILIYVVNHKTDLSSESIEKFEYRVESNELIWLRSFVDASSLRSVNDVAVVEEDEFYVSNDHYFSLQSLKILRILETYLFLRIGYVAHCKYDKCSIVTGFNLAFPNGIESRVIKDPETGLSKTEVLVVNCFSFSLDVYEKGQDASLTYSRSILIPASMDNLWISPNEDIYISGHPDSWKFLMNVWFPEKAAQYPSGSEVLKLASGSNDFEQVYLDDGFQFTGASIAVFWNENILLGSPGKNLMACHKL